MGNLKEYDYLYSEVYGGIKPMNIDDLSVHTEHGNFTYRVAAIIIKDNKVLLVKHEDHPCYYTVGGRVKINETSEEAVVREAYEETSVRFEIDKLAFIQERFLEINSTKHHEIVFFYLLKNVSGINILENSYTDQGPKETLHWFLLSDLDKYYIVPKFIKTRLLKDISGIEHIISKD